METNHFSESIEAFTKTTEVYENSVMYDDKLGLKHDAMTSIGEVYLLQKDFENAEKQFEKCLVEKKDREMINAILAVYIRLGFVDEAEEFFNDKGINIWMMQIYIIQKSEDKMKKNLISLLLVLSYFPFFVFDI